MQSPFEPPKTTSFLEKRTRGVRVYLISATIVILIALSLAFPGLVLLNQELGWIPTSGRIYRIERDGKSVPLQVAMRGSLLTGAVVGLPGLGLALRGIANWRWNTRKHTRPHHRTI